MQSYSHDWRVHTHTHEHEHVIFNDYQVENVNKAFSISLLTQSTYPLSVSLVLFWCTVTSQASQTLLPFVNECYKDCIVSSNCILSLRIFFGPIHKIFSLKFRSGLSVPNSEQDL